VEALEQKLSHLASSTANAQQDREDVVRKAVEATQGRADLTLRQQQLEYTHKIQVPPPPRPPCTIRPDKASTGIPISTKLQ